MFNRRYFSCLVLGLAAAARLAAWPGIEWSSAPNESQSGQGYYIEVHAWDEDGYLGPIRVWRQWSPFTYFGNAGDWYNDWRGNWAYDTGEQWIEYEAECEDIWGYSSGTIYHSIHILTPGPVAQPAVTSSAASIFVNDSFTPSYSGGAGTGAYQFCVVGYTNWDTAGWTASSAGTYTFRVRRLGDSNYLDSDPSDLYTLTVMPLPMTPPTSSDVTIYMGTVTSWSPSIYAPPENGNGTLMFCVIGYTNWGTESWVPIQAGTYGVYVGQIADSNHQGNVIDTIQGPMEVNTSAYTLTVNPGPANFTFSGGPFTYDGGAKSVAVSTDPSGATYSPSGTWSATEAGTYTAMATAYGSYTGSASYTWTIDKSPQDGVGVSPASQTITVGDSINFSASGSSGTGAYIWGGAASGSGSTNNVTFYTAGTWTVTVYRQGDNNYYDSNTATATVTVNNPVYSLTVQSGSGSVSGMTEGSPVSITADAPPSGQVFSDWTLVSGPGAFADVYASSTTFMMGAGNATVMANYQSTPPVITSVLTASGTVDAAFSYTITATNSPTSYGASGLPPDLSINTTTGGISGTPTAAGTYNVGLGATNSGGNDTATLVITVNKADQTLNFVNPGQHTLGDASFTLSATATSGLSVSYAIVSGPATVSGNTVTLTGAGTVTITASQVGNTNYNAAVSVDQSFTVASGTQTITFGVIANKAYPNESPFTLSAIASSGLPVAFSIVNGPATINGNTVTLTGSTGTVTIRASQAGNSNYQSAPNVDQSFTVTVLTPPTITTQPASQTVTAGQAVNFTVAATGTPTPTYQWRKNGTDISSGTDTPLTLTNVSTADAGSYDVIASNAVGSATSVVATLTVNRIAQTITFGTIADKTYPNESPFAVSATASSGLPVVFSVVSGPATVNGGAVTLTGSAGTVTIRAEQTGNEYYETAPNIDRSFTVTVLATPAITTQPVSQTVTAGANVTFTVAATGTPTLTYQWRKGGTDLSGATSASLTLNNVAVADAGSYDVIVSNAAGNVTSSAASLTVQTTPTITTQPANQTVITGQSATFTVTATGTPAPTYQWRKGGTAIPGATSATLTLTNASTTDEGSYDVIVSNVVGSVASSVVTLAIQSQFTVTVIGGEASPTNVGIPGTVIWITSNTPTGQMLLSWSLSGPGTLANTTEPSTSFIIGSGNATITASNVPGYRLRIGGGGSTDALGGVPGTVITITAPTPGSGQVFYGWELSGPGIVADTSALVTTVTMGAGQAYVASYNWLQSWAPLAPKTTITASAATVSAGQSFTVTATTLNWHGPLGWQQIDFSTDFGVTWTVGTVANSTRWEGAAAFDLVSSHQLTSTFTFGGAGTAVFRAWGSEQLYMPSMYSYTSVTINPSSGTPVTTLTASSPGMSDVIGNSNSSGSPSITIPVGQLFTISSTTTDSGGDLVTQQFDWWSNTDGTWHNGAPENNRYWSGSPTGSNVLSKTMDSAPSPLGVGTYLFRASGQDSLDQNSDYQYVNVVVTGATNVAPTITTQPQGQTVAVGANVTFTVAATGNPTPTYQWLKNGTDISGATSASYALTNVQTTEAGTYTVYVQNTAGSVTSDNTVLTVFKADQTAPTINGPSTGMPGTAYTFTASSGGGHGSLEWSPAATNTWSTSGTYTVQARWSGDANYNPSPYGTATITISSGAPQEDTTNQLNIHLPVSP